MPTQKQMNADAYAWLWPSSANCSGFLPLNLSVGLLLGAGAGALSVAFARETSSFVSGDLIGEGGTADAILTVCAGGGGVTDTGGCPGFGGLGGGAGGPPTAAPGRGGGRGGGGGFIDFESAFSQQAL